ncbi:MAG: universal stress protein [Alphaproteobacteria bacterium]
MPRKRTSYDPGHIPKYLVVVDDTPECDRAIVYAARRSARVGGRLVMLAIIETEDREGQTLFGVADVMREEAEAEARAKLDQAGDRVMKLTHTEPQLITRQGPAATAVVSLIEEDQDIAILVLAAGTGKDGPGPLVSSLARTAGSFAIPVALVPGQLSDDEIEALA